MLDQISNINQWWSLINALFLDSKILTYHLVQFLLEILNSQQHVKASNKGCGQESCEAHQM